MRTLGFAIIVLILPSAVAFSAEWVYVSKDSEENSWYYDHETVFREGDMIKVWVQLVAGERRQKELKQAFAGYAAVGTLSYERWRFEIFCGTNMFRVTCVHLYDTQGSLWLSENYRTDPFLKAVPGTPISHLVETVCKETTKDAIKGSRP